MAARSVSGESGGGSGGISSSNEASRSEASSNMTWYVRSMVSVGGGSRTSWATLLGVGVHGQVVPFSRGQRVEDIQHKVALPRVALPNTKEGYYALVALPLSVAYYCSMEYNGKHSCTVHANANREVVEVRQAALRSCSVCV